MTSARASRSRPVAMPALFVLAIFALFASAIAPTFAHHGSKGRFDVSTPLWVEGEVTEVYFGQPHPLITVRTPANLAPPASRPAIGAAADSVGDKPLQVRSDTKGRDLKIEFSAIPLFLELDGKVRVGDRIALIVFRNCDAPHHLRGQWVRLASGAPIARPGRVTSTQVQGC